MNCKYLYLFQWLNIYSCVEKPGKHPVYYSIYNYCDFTVLWLQGL